MNTLQPYLFLILLLFLAIGNFYPAVGLLAIICMLGPVVMSVFKGRYWCGNYCPRGSFYDSILTKFSPHKEIPAFFRSKVLRTSMVAIIMAMFSVQMYAAWGDLDMMGKVFIRLIFITTIVGIILGLIYNHRTWCAFCPMGTLANWTASKTNSLQVNNACIECGLCAQACPFNLSPYTAKGSPQGFINPDCLKCGKCIPACPKKAITY